MELLLVLGLLGTSYAISTIKNDKLQRRRDEAAFLLKEEGERQQDVISEQEAEADLLEMRLQKEAGRERREHARNELSRLNTLRALGGLSMIENVDDLMDHIEQFDSCQIDQLENDPESSQYFPIAELLITKRLIRNQEHNNQPEDCTV